MRSTNCVIALCSLAFVSITTFADSLTGKVVKITDGDTLYVLDANHIVSELFIRSFRLPTAAADSLRSSDPYCEP